MSPATVDATSRTASDDAIDAGSFPDRLAIEMEAEGPRHPFGHPDIGVLVMGTSSDLDRESYKPFPPTRIARAVVGPRRRPPVPVTGLANPRVAGRRDLR